jgi:uncharacterized protein YegL
MPKLLNNADMDTGNIPGLSGYKFSAVRTDRLGASEYTLVTIACDVSTSVDAFRDLLIKTVKAAVDGCRKSPRAANILVRVVSFNQSVEEVHGFKPLSEIDPDEYDRIRTGGATALYDACASAIGAMTEYGRILARQDYGVNGVLYIVTDGEDNRSTYNPATVRQKAEEALKGEVLESFASVLMGVNASDARMSGYLQLFQKEAGLTAYRDAGDATPGNMAKMAGFISQSVSSTANSLGTGQSAPLPVSGSATSGTIVI